MKYLHDFGQYKCIYGKCGFGLPPVKPQLDPSDHVQLEELEYDCSARDSPGKMGDPARTAAKGTGIFRIC